MSAPDVVSVRIHIARADLREVDRRASAAGVKREAVAAQLVAAALHEGPQPATASAADTAAAEHARFVEAYWRDAVEANPAIVDTLLRILET